LRVAIVAGDDSIVLAIRALESIGK
jgi:hypothetical protein